MTTQNQTPPQHISSILLSVAAGGESPFHTPNETDWLKVITTDTSGKSAIHVYGKGDQIDTPGGTAQYIPIPLSGELTLTANIYSVNIYNSDTNTHTYTIIYAN